MARKIYRTERGFALGLFAPASERFGYPEELLMRINQTDYKSFVNAQRAVERLRKKGRW